MRIAHLAPFVVTGTLPVRPFTDRFVGTVTADGGTAHVSAIACDGTGAIILLSLIGSDTTCGAAFAILSKDAPLTFTPAADLAWSAPGQLHRPAGGMRLHKAMLTGTYRRTSYHVLGLANTANIAFGLTHPPVVAPAPTPAPNEALPAPPATATTSDAAQPRYLLGNLAEGVPHPLALLGHLRALRIIFLPEWVDALWEQAGIAGLITTAPALGICAWRISDSRERWNTLLSHGVTQGWLASGASGAVAA